MRDRHFYDALKAAKSPLEFIHAVADQPLLDDDEGPTTDDIDPKELVDERYAIIEKAREFQRIADGHWLVDMRAAMVETRRILLGLSTGSRDELAYKLERMIDQVDKA